MDRNQNWIESYIGMIERAGICLRFAQVLKTGIVSDKENISRIKSEWQSVACVVVLCSIGLFNSTMCTDCFVGVNERN